MAHIAQHIFQIVSLILSTLPIAISSNCYCTIHEFTPIFKHKDIDSELDRFVPVSTCFTGDVDDDWITLTHDKDLHLPYTAVQLAENSSYCDTVSHNKRQFGVFELKSWTTWTTWSSCDGECWNKGQRTRTRTCFSITTKLSIAPELCNGTHLQQDNCYLNCTSHPLSNWGSWSFCPLPCNTSLSYRNRTCRLGLNLCNRRDSLMDNKTCDENLCAVNGGWSDWSEWNECSKISGPDGFRVRYRTCSNPSQKNGGLDCSGRAYMLKSCAITLQSGEWGPWETWSTCFGGTDCKPGEQFRLRKCIVNGTCSGNDYERKACTTTCILPAWNSWSKWSDCQVSCGEGFNMRTRDCNTTLASLNTSVCEGDNSETKNCSTNQPCPINGNYMEWSSWNACSVSCGTVSYKTRYRVCTAPKYGGQPCDSSRTTEITICNVQHCPVDGMWGSWTSWSNCTCANTRSRTRICDSPAPIGTGNFCTGNGTDKTSCTSPAGCPVDGGWHDWYPWSECEITCGTGSVIRTRRCSDPLPANGGMYCVGDVSESKECHTTPCPVDGGWAMWSSWSGCTVSCGNGTWSRARACTQPAPLNNGKQCPGSGSETSPCPYSCCPVDGGWGVWFPWTVCLLNGACPIGSRQRVRACNTPKPECGGQYCVGDAREKDDYCVPNSCVTTPAQTWSEWFYSPCTTTCGTGTTTRLRHCSSGHSEDCVGPSKEQVTCSENECPVNGAWSTWSNFSSCSVTCANGTATRARTCDDPQPVYGGKQCPGNFSESRDCHKDACPEWSRWFSTGCSVTCGVGNQTRIRHCSTGHSEDCDGADKEQSSCTNAPCPVDGNWTDWTTWSACDVTCETGHAQRTRTCTNPAPDYDGANCTGSSSSTKSCTLETCPSWSEWFGGCTVTCGGGTQSRLRFCSSGHDEDCPGDPFSSVPCSANAC